MSTPQAPDEELLAVIAAAAAAALRLGLARPSVTAVTPLPPPPPGPWVWSGRLQQMAARRSAARPSIFAFASAIAARRNSRRANSSGTDIPSGISCASARSASRSSCFTSRFNCFSIFFACP